MTRMPALFIGHGSPMNAIEDNAYTAAWAARANSLPRPERILCVSAHWFTEGTRLLDTRNPRMVYDMYGFPEALYRVVFAAPGAPDTAARARELIERPVSVDNSWGFDHGAWSVLCRMYPEADIPVLMLSVDAHASMEEHAAIGRRLRALRDEGVLIIGSGNIVHNLARIDWHTPGGYQWATDFDGYVKRHILEGNADKVIRYEQAGSSAALAFRTVEHYAPLLYAMGAAHEGDEVQVFNEACLLGSLSMTSYQFG